MRLTLHQLNVLRQVSAQGSVTAAAKAMHMTQPAVSNILKQLEGYFGQPVVEVVGKKLFLTKAGQRAVHGAEKIQTVLDETETDIAAMRGCLSGVINIATVSTAKYFMPRLLGAFHREYPDVRFSLEVCNREDVIQRLKENIDDVVIMSQPPRDMPIIEEAFYDDQLVIAAPNDFQVKRRHLALQDLADADWMIREQGSGTRIVMQKLFSQSGLSPNVLMEVGNNESIKQLIIAGLGISLVSLHSVELELDSGLIQVLPVKGFPMQHPWYWVTNRGKQATPLVQAFREYIKAHPDLGHYTSWKNPK